MSGFGFEAYYRDMHVSKRGGGEGEKRKEGGSSGCMYEVGKGGWGWCRYADSYRRTDVCWWQNRKRHHSCDR